MDAINSLIIRVSLGSAISAIFCISEWLTFCIFPGTPRSVITDIAKQGISIWRATIPPEQLTFQQYHHQ